MDGNVDGNWLAGSVSSTLNETQAWWQVDLGQIVDISKIRVWNRTDCCSNRLANFHVLISDTPFVSTGLAATQNQAGVIDLSHPGLAGGMAAFTVNQTGRYVRIQLAGTNVLTLAEVEVIGTH
ncbi:MAG: discoidin domain-containing protein [Methylococcales bacterium]